MSNQIPPWTKVFSVLALRGLLRVHHDYLLWSMYQNTNQEPDFESLNNGPGVAYADEPTVCAAISQEFLYSRYCSGVWIKDIPSLNIKSGARHYRIQREEKYPDSIDRADFRIDRMNPKTNKPFPKPVYIEAKRAFRWSTKLNSGQSKVKRLLDEIREDIKKLRQLTQTTRVTRDKPFGYILIWNITDKEKRTNLTPSQYLSELGDENIFIKQIKVAPLSCEPINNKKKIQDLRIERCVWLALVEVANPKATSKS